MIQCACRLSVCLSYAIGITLECKKSRKQIVLKHNIDSYEEGTFMDNKQKRDKWSGYFVVGLLVSIIAFFIMVNQEDASSGALIAATILLCGIAFCIISAVLINVYNTKAKNMSADEYLSDRFANAIPETKEMFGAKNKDVSTATVICPYCSSNNVRKITTVNRVVSTTMVGIASSKIGKQWHCNTCKSDF